MILLKLAALALWTAYAYSVGLAPDGLNGIGVAVALSFFLFAPLLYLYPATTAWVHENKNLKSIVLLNILLGWSIVGWVVAMAWAMKEPAPIEVD